MFLFLIFLCWGVSAAPNKAQYYSLEDAASYFEEFIIKHGKQYADEQEKSARFEIFKTNLKDVNQLNNISQAAVFGITSFTDLTKDEFKRLYSNCFIGEQDTSCSLKTDGDIPDAGAPESLDYRQMGYVSGVKNQMTCGDCYAFSSTGHLEGQYFKKHGSMQEFSEQQILDCNQKSSGCRGGTMGSSFATLIDLGGAMAERDYPYENQKGQCRSDASRAVARISACYQYSLSSQEKVKQLLYLVGPISIAVRDDYLKQYTGGIIMDSVCTGKVAHAVLLVGYGRDNGVDYWLIKNSWGAQHGEQGYFRVQRNGGPDGACGLLNQGMASADVE
ncbi:unnamed protein product [Arctia plantaginis]|uniref:Uncharacterized protein n=1 Tax=Arctia plantaginis TaxID=874455 RepID=A0A8S0ZB93_ARCPL|nr:unnamed protein product [Arctia plantaginis]